MSGASADTTLTKGDAVEWNSSGETVEGTVVKKLTKPTDIKGHHVAASDDNPEYLVRVGRDGSRGGAQAGGADQVGER